MGGEQEELKFSDHAVRVLSEREIPVAWVNQTVDAPALRTIDPNDSNIERFFRVIPEYGDRVLRVVVNTSSSPWRVVTLFFDRGMRGKL